jgi:hypothetical protein
MEKALHPVELKNVSYERNTFKFQKRIKELSILLFFLIVSTLATNKANAQTTPLPKDHPVKVAAPNLPEMVRATASEENVFHGLGYSYSNANEAKVKAWIAKFPAEVDSYKTAINLYIKDSETKTLNDVEKEIYSDLKSQFIMIIQLTN